MKLHPFNSIFWAEQRCTNKRTILFQFASKNWICHFHGINTIWTIPPTNDLSCHGDTIHLEQGRAKPNFWTRNRNQWVLKGNFRTTKSKPICINGIIRNQNRNQFLIYKKFEIKIKTKMQKAVLFKTKTETNIRSYLVTMTS